jgi:hypothetical protein
MFYCDNCAKEKKYSTSIAKSVGVCEICGIHGVCNDVPSKLLPIQEHEKPTYTKKEVDELIFTAVRQTMKGMFEYFKKDTIIVDKNGKHLPDAIIDQEPGKEKGFIKKRVYGQLKKKGIVLTDK